MRSRFAALVLTAMTLSAASVEAQTTFQFTGVNGANDHGVYLSPYYGTQGYGTTNTPVTLNCLDFFHNVGFGQVWQANITSLGGTPNLSNTRHPSGLSDYQLAARLIFNRTPSNLEDTQSAIWNLFGNNPGSNWPADNNNVIAAANATSPNYGQFYIVTDVRAAGINNDGEYDSVQEFMVYDPSIVTTSMTPEPASFVLFGTGIAGLAGVAVRRRKRQG